MRRPNGQSSQWQHPVEIIRNNLRVYSSVATMPNSIYSNVDSATVRINIQLKFCKHMTFSYIISFNNSVCQTKVSMSCVAQNTDACKQDHCENARPRPKDNITGRNAVYTRCSIRGCVCHSAGRRVPDVIAMIIDTAINELLRQRAPVVYDCLF